MKKIMGKTIVNFVLDKSGSMGSVQDATISGFNEYLNTLKKDKKSNFGFSLTLFDTETKNPYTDEKIDKVQQLDRKSYDPSGCTALYDAVCKSVKDLKDKVKKGEKVLTVIMTDGLENSSREYTQVHLKDMIKECEKSGNWTFVFLGANQDAWAIASQFGMQQGNVTNFNATSVGTSAAFTTVADNTMSYASSGQNSTSKFFSDKDKKDLLNSK